MKVKGLTWQELIDEASKMSDEQKATTVYVYVGDIGEHIPIDRIETSDPWDDDGAEEPIEGGHPCLVTV